MAASARPMASVLFPEPPFWVANTIVCISRPLDGCQVFGLRHKSCAAFCDAELRARSDVPSPIQRSGIAVVRISQFAIMPDYGIVVIRANTAVRQHLLRQKRQQETGNNMTGHWRDRAATSFQCQKRPATGSRGMVV